VISQTDNQYLDELITYNKVLANRNALLKLIADTGRYDPNLLEVLDEQLIVQSGNRIFEAQGFYGRLYRLYLINTTAF
jgi:DNA replication and repair protein RecF